MSYYFTDGEINNLITEGKSFSGTFSEMVNFHESDGNKRNTVDIPRPDGSAFVIMLRQNVINFNDFSAILGFREKGNNKVFKLRRYNGKSHEHTNAIEGNRFYNFHIHIATQRYQDVGRKEEYYAEETNRYSNLEGALKCMLSDCNINVELHPQTDLF